MFARFFYFNLLALILLLIAGCFHQSDDQVIENANSAYQIFIDRYDCLINSLNDKEVISNCRKLGSVYHLNPWSLSGIWNELCGNDHLTVVEGVPLYRACHLISTDLKEINKHVNYLESRMITNTPIYKKLNDLYENLNYAITVIKSSSEYLEESRFIENRRIIKNQLYEARRQRELLEDIATAKRSVPIYKETVITTRVEQKPKKKKIKEELEIDTGKISGKKAHIIIT